MRHFIFIFKQTYFEDIDLLEDDSSLREDTDLRAFLNGPNDLKDDVFFGNGVLVDFRLRFKA